MLSPHFLQAPKVRRRCGPGDRVGPLRSSYGGEVGEIGGFTWMGEAVGYSWGWEREVRGIGGFT